MEELLACALLYQAGLFPAGPYRETLDFLFRDDPEDPLLLELEWTAKDMEASVSLLQNACARRMEGFSPDRFGRMLMEGLRVSQDGLLRRLVALEAPALAGPAPEQLSLFGDAV